MWKKLVLNGFIIVWAIAAGVFISRKPWQVYQKQNEETQQRLKDQHDAEHKRDQLIDKESRAESSIGREEQARKVGYIGPGEAPDPSKK